MPSKKEDPQKQKKGKNNTQTQISLAHQNELKKRTGIKEKAGLIFPVGRILTLMKKGRYADRISPQSAIGVATVLEYLTAELFELSGDICFNSERKMTSSIIKPRHITLAIRGDTEMSQALGTDVIIPMGGVVPFIHSEMEMKKKKAKTKAAFKDDEAEEADDEETDEELYKN